MTRRLTRYAFSLSLLAWLGLIAVPMVNAQANEQGVWIRLCLGTGTSWVQLSLDKEDHPSQNNHCPCTQNTLDTAWQPNVNARPPLPSPVHVIALSLDPKPARVQPYLSRAPPFTTDV